MTLQHRASDTGKPLPPEAEARMRKEKRHEWCRRCWGDWWKNNALLVIAIGLIIVGAGTTFISIQFYLDQSKTREQAKALCARSKILGPYSTRFLIRENIYPANVFVMFNGKKTSLADLAISSIPTRCD